MSNFLIYNEHGEILRAGLVPAYAIELQAQDGETAMTLDGNSEISGGSINIPGYWVDTSASTPTLTEKLAQPLSVSPNGVITGVVDGTLIEVLHTDHTEETSYTVTDGEFDLSESSPGTYSLTMTVFPYLIERMDIVIPS